MSFHGTAQTTFTSNSATQLVLNVPAGATTGPLTVTTPSGTSAASSNFVVPFAITSLTPARNSRTAALTTTVAVGFAQNIAPATAGNIKVFSARAGGRKVGTYSTSANTVTFAPTSPFKAGETVFTSIPASVQSTSGGVGGRTSTSSPRPWPGRAGVPSPRAPNSLALVSRTVWPWATSTATATWT
ncbi:Ig-like domain-containing protein (plasmid) [Hymenobacter sp. BRD67]|nr:Ig-like domain-containing protein [Hymenobacter sp. BRD67]